MSVCLGPVLVFLFGALYRLSRFALRLIAAFVRAACIWRCLRSVCVPVVNSAWARLSLSARMCCCLVLIALVVRVCLR